MGRTAVFAVTGWLAAAAAATAAGVAAVALIGQGLAGPRPEEPLSQEAIAAALATASALATSPAPGGAGTPVPSSEASPSSSAGPAGNAQSQLLVTPGGSVIARCSGGRVTLLNWSPAQGYAVGEVRPGPDHEARVTFERGEDEIETKVWCADGVPQRSYERD